jgi:spore germination protein GerM
VKEARVARSPKLGLLAAALAVIVLGACSGDTNGGGTPSTTNGATTSPSATASTSNPPGTTTVQVFFVDQDAFEQGTPPYVTPVERTVDAADAPRGALDALFAGPSEEEGAEGLRLIASGATGISDLRIDNGTAHVTLAGGCASGGSTLSVGESIVATLRQFEPVQSVKIYDPSGQTESPDEPGDSIPECLEP